MSDFEKFWIKYNLGKVMKSAKTLSKMECCAIFNYMKKNKPKTILEFGVQYGCSSRLFVDSAKFIGYNLNLHSWDVIKAHKLIDKKEFYFHKEDITGKEKETFKKYVPDLVFLDAHVYALTKNLIELCLKKKVNFMAHDTELLAVCKRRSKDFTNFSNKTNAQWEPYLLGKLIHKDLWSKDVYENDKVLVRLIRDKYGLGIIEHK